MEPRHWHTLTPEEALAALESDGVSGLTGEEAARRLERFGPNALAREKRPPVLLVFLGQFKDLMVGILLLAAAISALTGSGESTLVILAVLLLNAVLGTVQHVKAEQSLESLRAMSAPAAKVLRDGTRLEIPAAQVVPGDLVLLEAGDLAAADGRILESAALKVNESALTGESEGVEKTAAPLSDPDAALADRVNMAFSGALVTYGRGVLLVTGTGMDTELGRVAALMNRTRQRKTPLQQSLDQFSKRLAVLIVGICGAVFLLALLHKNPPLDALMFAVALAVAAVPEALSSIVTIVQAMGTRKMARQNAIIKDLKAVETLGAVSVICSDKTGTLTQNRMTPRQVYADGALLEDGALDLANPAHRRLLQAAVLACDATEEDGTAVGDPTEVALVLLGDRYGVEENAYRRQHPRLGELAFDSDRKLMSTLHDLEGVPTLYTKGAMDVLLERSVSLLTAAGPVPMTEERRAAIVQVNRELSARGLRVLAFACRTLDAVRPLTPEDEDQYAFIGLISMVDPPRPEAIQAVAGARRGGVRTIMITGDHKGTAAAIAEQLGILRPGDEALSGPELDALDGEALDRRLAGISVYARVSPEHKIRIVEAWQRQGRVVAMTGDGVNDAPALKAADIGVAMGITGTEVSKDAAAMILADDNFATIVQAVVNGRGVYANLRNAVLFLLSGNMAGILCVVIASLLGLPMPFAAVHLLFINLITDSLPAVAIGLEPARPGLLDQKPRDPGEPILNRALLLRVLGYGGCIAAAALAAFALGLSAPNGGAGLASTLAFATLTLARLFHGFNCRGEAPLLRLGLASNRASLGAFAAGAVLLAAVLLVPGLTRLFSVSPFTPGQLGAAVLLAALPTLGIQLWKIIAKKA